MNINTRVITTLYMYTAIQILWSAILQQNYTKALGRVDLLFTLWLPVVHR